MGTTQSRKQRFKEKYGFKNIINRNRTIRRQLFYFYGGCESCKRSFDIKELTVDHIKPLSMGGRPEFQNAQLLCVECHRVKTEKDNKDYMDSMTPEEKEKFEHHFQMACAANKKKQLRMNRKRR